MDIWVKNALDIGLNQEIFSFVCIFLTSHFAHQFRFVRQQEKSCISNNPNLNNSVAIPLLFLSLQNCKYEV